MLILTFPFRPLAGVLPSSTRRNVASAYLSPCRATTSSNEPRACKEQLTYASGVASVERGYVTPPPPSLAPPSGRHLRIGRAAKESIPLFLLPLRSFRHWILAVRSLISALLSLPRVILLTSPVKTLVGWADTDSHTPPGRLAKVAPKADSGCRLRPKKLQSPTCVVRKVSAESRVRLVAGSLEALHGDVQHLPLALDGFAAP